MLSELDEASFALLESQSSLYVARVFFARPTSSELQLGSSFFRVLLLRRFRLPLPLAAAACRCRRHLDDLGDHIAACLRSGILRSRGVALEHAAARVFRQAGATLWQHVLVRDLNVVPARCDERHIEVIANGLPLWNGAQVAVDTTLVTPLTSSAELRRLRGNTAGAALRSVPPAEAKSGRALSWSVRGVATLSFSALNSAVGGAPRQRLSSACSPAAVPGLRPRHLRSQPSCFAPSNLDGDAPLLSDILADSSEGPPLASRLA